MLVVRIISGKICKIFRYCDYLPGGKAITIYKGCHHYENTELRSVKGWRKAYKKPIYDKYVFLCVQNIPMKAVLATVSIKIP